jgi:hypothetical protein
MGNGIRDWLETPAVSTTSPSTATTPLANSNKSNWDGRCYRNLAEVRADLGRMIDEIYNREASGVGPKDAAVGLGQVINITKH